MRVFENSNVTIAAGGSGSCPVPADRGWFELVRCHSDAVWPINTSSARATAFVSQCSEAGRQPLWRLLQPGSSSGGASTPAPAATELSGARL
ncbi:tectonic-2 [Platysternon megacephalum]|uniref:Tectonic-2 n=1 Tax=Platysternon megacephalum TaxID=55544 RepID=A0A4D9F4E9_9SAUR|nr:tectonic-2 [Platysternon megacephalum]